MSYYFPNIPPIDPSRTYQAIIEGARREYNKIYQPYSDAACEIEALARHWEERYKKIEDLDLPREGLQQELNKNVDEYIKYRKMREEAVRINRVFEDAVIDCTPPHLDPGTLEALGKLSAKVSDIEAVHKKVFKDDLEQLKEQKGRIAALLDKITKTLRILKISCEPLAIHCHPGGWSSYLPSLRTAPFVSALVDARVDELQRTEMGKQPVG